MKFKPEQWTHHHTHRLFHISLGLCFGFISVIIVSGMAAALFTATADDNTPKSGNLIVAAQVEGVNPGPIDPGHFGSKPPVATVNPTITIVAEPKGQVPQQGSVYVFNTQFPAFSGVASVPNGLIFITIRGQEDLNSTAQADVYGQWYWKSPEALPEGKYGVTAAVFDSYDLTRSGSAKADFMIKLPLIPQPPTNNPTNTQTNSGGTKPPTPSNPSTPSTPTTPEQPTLPLPPVPTVPTNVLFGAFITVMPDYKTVETGKKVVVGVSLVSNSGKEVSNQRLDFKVTSPKGKIILQTSDIVSFSAHAEYLKTFYIAPATPEGEYTVTVTAVHYGIPSESSDTFNIKGAAAPVAQTAETVQQWPALLWVLMIMLLLLFIVLTIMAYHQVRHHSRELDPQP